MSGIHNSDGQGPRKVVIVAYDGAKLMDISGPLQAFSDACFPDGRPAYRVVLASESGGSVCTDTRVRLETVRLDDTAIDSVDTLLIAGGDLIMPAAATASLRTRLADYLDRPRRLGSVCTGAFVLAQLGVLDRRDATTHWAACSRLENQHPTINVKPDAIFVTSDHIWTSAGVSAGIDMALHLIERFESPERMASVRRYIQYD